MNAQVIPGFTLAFNRLEAARQAYLLAKEYRRRVLTHSTWDRQRYLDALDREDEARELYFGLKYP